MSRGDIFISHSKQDHTAAEELVSQLEARGIECWFAPRDVPPGAVWSEEILNAIAVARVMLLVFSVSANDSKSVRREVELAYERGVRVLPFRIADVEASGPLKFFLTGQQWVDAFPPPVEPHYARLCNCLNTILAVPPNPRLQPDPSPPPDPRPPVPPFSPGRSHVTIEPANLRRLVSELAFYIGPVATWEVNRAAAHASDVETLLLQLGGQIKSETQRRTFIAACRHWLRAPPA
jgi:hypothetical protein